MCFDLDSHPPIIPIAGGALDSSELVLDAPDGNRLRAFRARATEANGAGVVILPDVRGLHPYYEELALRFAENGVDAVAIDYFGRSAGLGRRGDGFEYMPHVAQSTWAGVSADIRAGAANLLLQDEGRVTALFTVGFCFGGRLAFLSSTLGLELAGAIGFYGIPVGPGRNDIPAPIDLVHEVAGPILGLFGGADPAIPLDAIAAFDRALGEAGVEHRIVTYDGAPHSFFDRKAADFADASAKAWEETLTFVRGHVPNPVGR
ncbi:MAG TPA: dienelactone hydrolase family protein [Candidatus Limnocylindrales bacterium]|nr:dienelactone hydrolase family protein [Candidatus Limnocylindrales bacterium]